MNNRYKGKGKLFLNSLPELKSLEFQSYAKVKMKVDRKQRVRNKSAPVTTFDQIDFGLKNDVLATPYYKTSEDLYVDLLSNIKCELHLLIG
ncbi:hypothetical protein LJR153_002152 [Paenibacillus sp. LjRoot153]|uniref:hypothetical protein n=1 Tax=Paenibacillus sp. LjRoot153 TaxID=3342270 RepID=UPI003ECD09D9